ncbi:MAG: HDOD domain-containing protein [Betaproteobacteria bacterium]|nr:HDOD domain-containing protein [Betaproteobacteria bacterium]
MAEHHDQADIAAALNQIHALPSLPSLVFEILDSLEGGGENISTIVDKIQRDNAVVARVLRVANSSFFGMSRKVGSIPQAVTILGLNNLRGLVMAASLVGAFSHSKGGLNLNIFWQHSFGAAVSAKSLASRVGQNPEIAFTAGLLHDIGKLIMEIYFPGITLEIPAGKEDDIPEQLLAEQAAYGFNHATLGSELTKRWNIPLEISNAVAMHHELGSTTTPASMAAVVSVANLISHVINDESPDGEQVKQIAAVGIPMLGITEFALEEVIADSKHHHSCIHMLLGN